MKTQTLHISAILLFLFIAASALSAQQTRSEVIKATSPEQDGKSNSDAVPDVISMSCSFEHVEILRFKYKTDLLQGLRTKTEELGIRNAVILAGIGSVRDYHIHSVSNRVFPSHNIYIRDTSAPADIAGMNGYIIDGRVHAHITLTSEDRAFGGHLEEGTHVFTFAIVTIGVLDAECDLSRVDDKTYR